MQARLSVRGGRPSHPPERGLPKAQPHFLASPPPRNPTKPSRAAASVVACEPWCSNAGHAPGGVSKRPAVRLILTPPQGLCLPSQLTAGNSRTPPAAAPSGPPVPSRVYSLLCHRGLLRVLVGPLSVPLNRIQAEPHKPRKR